MTAITVEERHTTVHNLTVAGLHTYHVGSNEVLVHNDGYHPVPKELPSFPGARRVKPKTSVQGGGGLRARWEMGKLIREWDSQHGEVEMCNKRGKHLGAFDPNTGTELKGPVSNRKCRI